MQHSELGTTFVSLLSSMLSFPYLYTVRMPMELLTPCLAGFDGPTNTHAISFEIPILAHDFNCYTHCQVTAVNILLGVKAALDLLRKVDSCIPRINVLMVSNSTGEKSPRVRKKGLSHIARDLRRWLYGRLESMDNTLLKDCLLRAPDELRRGVVFHKDSNIELVQSTKLFERWVQQKEIPRAQQLTEDVLGSLNTECVLKDFFSLVQ
jgi:hypothetical protein